MSVAFDFDFDFASPAREPCAPEFPLHFRQDRKPHPL